MSSLRMAVVGAGHLGTIHARLLRELDDVQLVGVVDPDAAARQRVADQLQVPVYEDYQTLASQLDAVILAAPTRLHHQLGLDLLGRGLHLFVEKPLASSFTQAHELVETADRQQRVLQVGHVERFNPALQAVRHHLTHPRYIEAVRTSSHSFRSTDIGVVLDLMIHDLDVILSLVASPVIDIQALGLTVLGPHEDMAQARLVFANGCVANLTASRTSYETTRRMRVFTNRLFASLDFAQGTVALIRPSDAVLRRAVHVEELTAEQRAHYKEHLFDELLPLEQIVPEKSNAILEEQKAFVASIRSGSPVQVPGSQARDALSVAQRILAKIALQEWTTDHDSSVRLPRKAG